MLSDAVAHPERISDPNPVAIIGAGPAGLTAAYQLGKRGRSAVVYEGTDAVGGISQTVERDGWRFDIGGHRFFTKVPEVEALWHELLDEGDFLTRPRMSRIYYQGKLFDYPLKASNALGNLGIFEAIRCLWSYAMVRLRPPKDQTNFEGWVAARFGWRLYRIFFKTYTEKVWGCDAREIQADWAAQRIKNLSLISAIRNALLPKRSGEQITSLIEEFQYPKYGPGMMWERARDRVTEMDVAVHLETPVSAIEHANGRATAVRTGGIRPARTRVAEVISSMPIGDLVAAMDPPAPAPVLQAARDLRHRDFLTVALVVPEKFSFPDNWIYVHDPNVSVGRIQNFGSWSPYLVKDGRTCLGLEFFVNEGDELWCAPDEQLIELAERELEILNLVPSGVMEAGYVVRMPKAYPVYDEHYQRNVDVLRAWLAQCVPNVHPVGRNGMHRYNNSDHSMMTAMLAVENICAGRQEHDVWSVNVEEDYHEQHKSVPQPTPPHTPRHSVSRPSAKPVHSGSGRDAPIIPRGRTLVRETMK